MFLDNIRSLRADKAGQDEIIVGKEAVDLYPTMLAGLKDNSVLLNEAKFIISKPNGFYYFNMNDLADTITLLNGSVLPTTDGITETFECKSKSFGIQVKISGLTDLIFNNDATIWLKNSLYKPFSLAVEKQLIYGNFFDKPLFSTNNTITGTKDFNGLLTLARTIRQKTDNPYIVGHPDVISVIVDTITDTAYKNEILLNNTIEGVKIYSTINAPAADNKFLVAVNPANICMVLAPDVFARKVSSVGDINIYYQFFIFINGGIISDKCIAMEV